MTRTRTVIVAGTVLAVLGLAGCSSDDPEPKLAPPSSAAPTSPSAMGSEMGSSEQMFVETYFRLIGDATTTGDTSNLMAASDQRCANCRTLAHNIEKAFEGRSYVEGAHWSVSRVVKGRQRPEGTEWKVDVATERERWFDGSGSLIKIVRPSTQRFGVIVSGHDGTFRVHDLRLR